MEKKKLLNELKNVFEVKKIDEKMNLNQLDIDSLKILNLIALKETKFKNLNIKPIEFHNCKTVMDILKLFKIK